MKPFEIDNLNLAATDIANMFNVYTDPSRLSENTLGYAINRTAFFKDLNLASNILFDRYTIKEGDEWSHISYRYYGTVDLWWLICKINGIHDPSRPLEVERIIRLLKQEYTKSVLNAIRGSAA